MDIDNAQETSFKALSRYPKKCLPLAEIHRAELSELRERETITSRLQKASLYPH